MNNWLEHVWTTWQAGGVLLIPLAVLCVGIWGYAFRTDGKVRELRAEADGVRRQLEAEKNSTWKEMPGRLCVRWCKALDVIARGARPLHTFEQLEEEVLSNLRRDLVVLSALTAAAPLVGLLGTVAGMIETFDAVATVAGDTGRRVAGGISQALITTQFGLVIAMPGVFLLAHLYKQIRDMETLLAQCRFLLLDARGLIRTGERV